MPQPRKYRVLWSAAAAADLEAILDHIAHDHPASACKILTRIHRKAAKLKTFPARGRVVREFQDHGITQYRELITAPWRIIYRIEQRQVHVLAVVDARRNLEDLLLERLTR